MFTGLIEETGRIKSTRRLGGGMAITVEASKILEDISIDDSISIDGVCQTVVAFDKSSFTVEAIEETLRKTTFVNLKAGSAVNLERAMKLGDRLGGHIVQGHVDCVGTISSINKEKTGINLWITFDEAFSKYIVNTGSVCINGISLTTAEVKSSSFRVSIIPHTWNNTTLAQATTGKKVNLEFDIIGKYINKIAAGQEKTVSSLDRYIEQPDY